MANPKRVIEESRKVLHKKSSYLMRLLREGAPEVMVAECVAEVVYAAGRIIGRKKLRKIAGVVAKQQNLRKARLCITCLTNKMMPKRFICQVCNDKNPEAVLRDLEIRDLMKGPARGQNVH